MYFPCRRTCDHQMVNITTRNRVSFLRGRLGQVCEKLGSLYVSLMDLQHYLGLFSLICLTVMSGKCREPGITIGVRQ